MKKAHYITLYAFVTIVFVVAIVGLNLKYDRYYRVPGITNENRILIELYLDEDEQEFLVENSINMDLFIDYIREPNFKLKNYEFYNQIEDYTEYGTLDEMLQLVNRIIDSLNESASWKVEDSFSALVEYDLLLDYDQNEDFYFDFIEIYAAVKEETDDSDYLTKTNQAVEYFIECGYDLSTASSYMQELVLSYRLDNILDMLQYALDHQDYEFILNPNDFTTIVHDNNYLSDYQPADAVIMEDVPRLYYFTYVKEEVYEQYLLLYEAFLESGIDEELLVVSGFQSLEDLNSLNETVSEEQLGMTLHLKVYGLTDEMFSSSKAKEWLDENAHLYGFVLRYPEDTEDITGHESESYTYRYVGEEAAAEIYNTNCTLEEYMQ